MTVMTWEETDAVGHQHTRLQHDDMAVTTREETDAVGHQHSRL